MGWFLTLSKDLWYSWGHKKLKSEMLLVASSSFLSTPVIQGHLLTLKTPDGFALKQPEGEAR